MRKYLFIFKSEVMTNLQYAFDMLLGFVSYVIHIFIFLNLWRYIYSDSSQLINGYNVKQMIWYVIITELLWSSISGRGLCRKICEDVRSGNIAYNINKPYSYVEYSLFSHAGATTVKFVLLTIIGMSLGLVFLNSFPSLNILEILGVLLTCILALVINMFLIISIKSSLILSTNILCLYLTHQTM